MAEYLTRCEQIVRQELGDNLTDSQQEKLAVAFRDLEDNIKRVQAEDASLTSEEAALKAAEDMVQQERLSRAIEIHQKAVNLKLKVKNEDLVLNTTFGADSVYRPDISLSALLVGRNEAETGMRASVYREQKNLEGKYLGGFFHDLDKSGFVKELASGEYDREISDAIYRIGSGEDLSGLSKPAISLANVIGKWSEVTRLDKNKAGAWVRKLPGYIVRQSHDMYKLRAAGYESWRDSILPRLDPETFDGVLNKEEFLKDVFKNLSSGIHLNNKPQEDWLKGFKGGGANIAKRASQDRVLKFRDGIAWHEYNSEFGTGSLRESVVNGLRHSANATGLMRILGTNPESMFDHLYDAVQHRLHADSSPEAESDFFSKRAALKNQLDEVMGMTSIPGNATLARTGAAIRAFESMTKLGGSVVSQFSDLGNAAQELRYQGMNLFDGLQQMIMSKFKRYSDVEKREILTHIGIFSNEMREEMIAKSAGDTSIPGSISRLQNKFFKYNLMSWWTDSTRSAIGMIMSHHLADNSVQEWGDLGRDLKRVLDISGIGEREWELFRAMPMDESNGNKHMTVNGIRSIPDDRIADYVTSNGVTISPVSINNAREDLASKLRGYYLDRILVAMAEPGARAQALMKQGTQPGTALGEALRFVGQFKSFTVSFMQNVMGRELFGKGYSPAALGTNNKAVTSLWNAMRHGEGEMRGMAQMFVAATAFGFLSMQTKLLIKGQTTRPIDHKTIMASMAQGGGLGILGDYLFGEYNRFGNDPVTSLAGPTVSDMGSLVTLYQKTAAGDAKAADAFRFAIDHTPFVNLHIVRPALNYLILNQIQEILNPGSLERYQNSVQKNQGNSFIIPPSRFMLGQ